MKITILEETKREIVLKVEDECCPFCNSNKIRNKGNYLSKINKECIKKFFLKDVYLKRIRYQCNDCNKCFSEKIFFRDILDEKFKPYLRILLDRDIIMLSVIEDYNIKKLLDLDNYWYILREGKFLTLINYKTLEVKEFFYKKQKKEDRLELKSFKRKGKMQ